MINEIKLKIKKSYNNTARRFALLSSKKIAKGSIFTLLWKHAILSFINNILIECKTLLTYHLIGWRIIDTGLTIRHTSAL